MGIIYLEIKRIDNQINICSINVLFNKFPLLKKLISYFTRNLPKNQQSTIDLCLKLIVFGRRPNLLIFGDKYFKYSHKGIKTKGLALGGYESDLLVNLVVSCPSEKCNNQLREVQCKGIYMDNGLVAF